MSLSKNYARALGTVVLLLCTVPALGGCGFTPLYGEQTAAAMNRHDIEIGDIPNREGQILRNLMIDRLYGKGSPERANYRLDFTPLDIKVISLGVQRDATATRGQIDIATTMKLINLKTGTPVVSRNLRGSGAYNLLDNQLATLVAEQNVTDNILREIAQDAVGQLGLYFNRTAP